jgi:hypothetical protein
VVIFGFFSYFFFSEEFGLLTIGMSQPKEALRRCRLLLPWGGPLC